jgi:hypothetical protein
MPDHELHITRAQFLHKVVLKIISAHHYKNEKEAKHKPNQLMMPYLSGNFKYKKFIPLYISFIQIIHS